MLGHDSTPALPDVLADINQIRTRRGMPALTALPAGTRSAFDCPLSRAFGGTTATRTVHSTYSQIRTPNGRVLTTPTLRRFLRAFDQGEYPALELVA